MAKVIRPIRPSDQKAFTELVLSITMGMTSLPKSPEKLLEKIEHSELAFRFDHNYSHPHQYIFVLEDTETGEIQGTCGMKAKTGVTEPSYNYVVEPLENQSSLENVPNTLSILRPIEHRNGPTELCGLYLFPAGRGARTGRLLSYCRFLFIKAHPQRFDKMIFAEMRGFFNEQRGNPFWDLVGRKFWDVSYKTALDTLSLSSGFIPAILPRFPLYIDLLPKEAQEVIGTTHPNTKPAVELLESIGFTKTREVDVMGVAPKLLAERDKIALIRESKQGKVVDLSKEIESETHFIVANTSLDFRAMSAVGIERGGGLVLQKEVAELLRVQKGDPLIFFPLSV